MTRVVINGKPSGRIPVLTPKPGSPYTESLYAEAYINDGNIVITPPEGAAPFEQFLDGQYVVDMLTVRRMQAPNPFLDGNGLDEQHECLTSDCHKELRADREPTVKLVDVASLHPQEFEFPRETWEKMQAFDSVADDRCDQSEEPETGMAEEPLDAMIHRLEDEKARVDVIRLIMHYKNYASDAEKLRQIRQVI